MTRRQWHILKEEGALTLARRVPVRFDLAVETQIQAGAKLRLAQQIRQDIWRVLQHVRGYSPVVRVESAGDMVNVIAGGQVNGRFAKDLAEARIAEVLENPANRARWQRCSA